jgi:CBS domain-containing protein
VTPRGLRETVVKQAPTLAPTDQVQDAVRRLIDSGLPALPVMDERKGLVGIFGEREFVGALFPGYVTQLGYAGFVREALDDALERRQTCRSEPIEIHMNTEHIDVASDFSAVQVAEIFLHHRVLIVPVMEGDRLMGVITRRDFFEAVAGRFLGTA